MCEFVLLEPPPPPFLMLSTCHHISCSQCNTLAKGCPDYEDHVLFAKFFSLGWRGVGKECWSMDFFSPYRLRCKQYFQPDNATAFFCGGIRWRSHVNHLWQKPNTLDVSVVSVVFLHRCMSQAKFSVIIFLVLNALHFQCSTNRRVQADFLPHGICL